MAGSCLTRDNFNGRFNPEWRTYFAVVASANQSSIISLMSPPIDAPIEPLRPMRAYDRWNIHSDLAKEFLPALADTRPSLLVLDFQADVRFGVAQLPDGRYFTDHHWKTRQTDFYARLDRAGELRFLRPFEHPDAYFDALGRGVGPIRHLRRGGIAADQGGRAPRTSCPENPGAQETPTGSAARAGAVPAC